MEEKILAIKERYDTVLQQLNDPEIISNNDVIEKMMLKMRRRDKKSKKVPAREDSP